MRDYDKMQEDRETEFKVRGVKFDIQPISLKKVGVWIEREKPVDIKDSVAFQQMCIDRVADAVDDGNGASERWRELCASDKGPSYGELLDLSQWVWETASDLPTQPSAPSEPGRGTTAVSSVAG